MKRELLSRAVGDIDARYIAEACPDAADTPAGAPERNKTVKTRRIITLALAAALLLSLSVAAYAAYGAVTTPQAAERVAQEQLAVWREMGLVQPNFVLEGPATKILEFETRVGSENWYGRIFPHYYDVRYSGGKYGALLHVDTLTGKIMYATLTANADEGRTPSEEYYSESIGQTLYFYDNFEDIFPADLTVDRYCSLLAQYWGFSGYRLADTVDTFYYDEPQPAVPGDSLLRDMSSDTRSNYYLTVFFEGDQAGAPMYIQLQQFPGQVCLMLGTEHAVG